MSKRPAQRRWRPAVTWAVAGGLVVALVVAGTGIATGQFGGESGVDAPGADHDRVFADFASPQIGVSSDGTPLTVFDNGRNTHGLAALDSELAHGAPTAANAAGYLEARMSLPVNRIGAIVEFHSANSGAVGLISSSESIAAANRRGSPDRLPNAGIVFAASTTNWHLGVWDSEAKTEKVLLQGTLALAPDGLGHAFEVTRYGDTAVVRLPDGTMQATADWRIAQWSGPWASWELYEYDPGRVPVTLASVWAS